MGRPLGLLRERRPADAFDGLLLAPVTALLLLVMFVLPFFSAAQYSMTEHTLSELGAQGAPRAWVMNAVFVALGVASVIDGWPRLAGLWFHRLALGVFGVALVLAAVFRHAPVAAETAFSAAEDEWHSTFSGLVGVSFVAFSAATLFAGTTGRRRWLGPAVGGFAIAMSILIFEVPDYAGVWQRLLFAVSFAWLVVFLSGRPRAPVVGPHPLRRTGAWPGRTPD